MTTKPSRIRRAALVAAIPFVASLPACGWLIRPEPTASQPAPESQLETAAKAVAPLLPPPFNLLLPLGIGTLVTGATIVAGSKVQPKDKKESV